MTAPIFRPQPIFAALTEAKVRFVAIGGWAAGAQGAGWPTYDVDVVITTDDENLARLAVALEELGAVYDTFHQPPIAPDERRLRQAAGPQLFRTRFGRLDVLKEAGGETFETLAADAAEVMQLGLAIRCASLPALLRMKRAANRPKDAPAIAIIEAALRRQSS